MRTSSTRCARSFFTGLPLEVVVPVRAAAADGLEKAGAEVEGKEENAPALVLAYMDLLVCAAPLENRMIYAEHDVPDCHCTEAQRMRQT